ncbi:MAG: pyridoxal phosphate-dependent aminotransferase [Clostridia bacterium]|jgi:aspartate/methionine/tyrosine aminotransferase|nr:pyridoxal phosphate-dependent aminotransferase [Clostridia bacterium]MCI1998980.1 pyridoxal phosphate-dependent aminotransferase [Clostridia bacterium]MCI2013730.1 pyridoxal phosphate-dependent aminotransferase [Clostridia bacterium]
MISNDINDIAERISRLGTESAFEVLNKAKALEAKGVNVIHLEIGQPDFRTPDHVSKAACDGIMAGHTGYTSSQGELFLREAIAKHSKEYYNINTNPDEIVVVPGGKPIMFFTMLSLINPGDEVIYPNPGFPIYESCINFAGGVPVPCPMLMENGFKIDAKQLKKLITDKTKLVIINSPGNPTGGVMEEKDIREIADILKDKDIYVLSDEIYSRLIFNGVKHFSIASIPEMKDKTVVLNGFSKPYAMTGWRIGYGIMNRQIAQTMTTLMVNSSSCVAGFIQEAAKAALEGPQDCVKKMAESYKDRLNFVVDELNNINGIKCLMPKGSFYLFPDISETGLDDKDFAERLLNEAGVATLAGSSFGKYGSGHIRISGATSKENLEEALRRIENFVEKLKVEKLSA